MATPHIRPADREDVGPIASIERRCFVEPWPPIAFVQFLDAAGFLVAIEPGGRADADDEPPDGAVVGYVVTTSAADEPRRKAHVRNIAVSPGRRRQGIASRLLAASLDRYRRAGYERVKLEVRSSNGAAIDLYRGRGYRVTRRLPGYYDDGETALVMERRLVPPAD